jgi:hypothetical protein
MAHKEKQPPIPLVLPPNQQLCLKRAESNNLQRRCHSRNPVTLLSFWSGGDNGARTMIAKIMVVPSCVVFGGLRISDHKLPQTMDFA